jgi:tRNA nucleotidyltransferase/poly(A) polymerase
LLGLPVSDVDVATSAHPEQVEALFPRTVAVGRSFGVVIVLLDDHDRIEVATFRHDGVYIDGRRPVEVTFSSAIEDVCRRDFTINALLYDPESGMVVDHVNGLADLAAGLIRTVGDPWQRFHEDRLRQIRALRFAARLGFTIEETTWAALIGIPVIGLSRERILAEWDKGLSLVFPSRWADLVWQAGLVGLFLPSRPSQEAWERLRVVMQRIDAKTPLFVRQTLWLHICPVTEIRAWLETQPVSKTFRHDAIWLLMATDPIAWKDLSQAGRCRLVRHAHAAALLAFCRCRDGEADAMYMDLQSAHQQAEKMGPWSPLLRPSDLIALGFTPGRDLGRALTQLEDAQFEGRLTTVEAARSFALSLLLPRTTPS